MCRQSEIPEHIQGTIKRSWIRTDDMEDALETKKKVKSTVGKFYTSFLIVIFMIVVMILTVKSGKVRYMSADGINNYFGNDLFVNDEFVSNYTMNFTSIRDETDYWNWFFSSFQSTVVEATNQTARNSMILLWGAHFFVHRVKADDGCSVPSSLTSALSLDSGCFADASYTNCLVTGNGTSYEISQLYKDASTYGNLPLSGLYADYSSSGFVQSFDFGASPDISQTCDASCSTGCTTSVSFSSLRDYYESKLFEVVDSGDGRGYSSPRLANVRFYIYNPNLDLFNIVQMFVELGLGGDYRPGIRVHTVGVNLGGTLQEPREIVSFVFVVLILVLEAAMLFRRLSTMLRARSHRNGCIRGLGGIAVVCSHAMYVLFHGFIIAIVAFYAYLLLESDMGSTIKSAMTGTIDDFPTELITLLREHEYASHLMVIALCLSVFRLAAFSVVLGTFYAYTKTIVDSALLLFNYFLVYSLYALTIAYAVYSLFGARLADAYTYGRAIRYEAIAHPTISNDWADIALKEPILVPLYSLAKCLMYIFIVNIALGIIVESWLRMKQQESKNDANRTREYRAIEKYTSALGRSMELVRSYVVDRFLDTLSEEEIIAKIERWRKETTYAYDASTAEWLSVRILQKILSEHDEDDEGDEDNVAKRERERREAVYEQDAIRLFLFASTRVVSEASRRVAITKRGKKSKERGEKGMTTTPPPSSSSSSLSSSNSIREEVLTELKSAIDDAELRMSMTLQELDQDIVSIGEKNLEMRNFIGKFGRKLKMFKQGPEEPKRDGGAVGRYTENGRVPSSSKSATG